MSDPFDLARSWLADGRRLAWVVVLRTWGSAPSPVGSALVVAEDGAFAGSVSGGCVEAEALERARASFERGPQRWTVGVSDDTAWQHGLPCGGELELLASPLTELPGEGTRSVDLETLEERWTAFDPGEARVEGGRFLQPIGRDWSLLIVGGVHIAQALAPMARQIGFAVTVIDPRARFLTEARFPDAERLVAWPADALRERLHSRAAVVVLTHDPKIDDDALRVALPSDAFYVGALGSRRNQAARRERLTPIVGPRMDRLHGPVGLDIGARTPPEIAASILAELIRERRR